MPTVYDRDTMQPVQGSPEELAAGIASGRYGFDASAGTITLKGADGFYKATPDKAAQYLATGEYSLPSAQEEAAHQVEKEEAAKGLGGSLEEAGKSGLNQLLLGVPEAISEESETPEQRATREAQEQYHAVARTIGGIAGFGGSMLAGGELFKGIEMAGKAASGLVLPAEEAAHALLARKVAANAVNYAAQGALLSAPQAIVQAAFGDPNKAAETLLWGVGTGAVLGVPAELLSSGAGAIAKKAGDFLGGSAVKDALEEKVQSLTPDALGAQKSQIGKLDPEWRESVVNFAHDEGLVQPGMDKKEIGAALKATHAKYSGQIGETIGMLDKALSEGKPEVIEKAMTPGKIGDAIREAFDTPEMKMDMNRDQANAIATVAGDADKLPTIEVGGQRVVPFEEAQKFVTMLRGKYVKAIGRAENNGGLTGLQTVTPLDVAKRDAYAIVKNVLHQAGDDVAVASGNTKLVGALVKDKRALAQTAELEKWIANNEAREIGNRKVGLTDWIQAAGDGGPISKVLQGAGAAVGGMLGGGAGAVAGMSIAKIPGTYLDYVAKHWMEDKGLITMSAIARKAAAAGDGDVFAAVLGTEGQARLNATMQGVQETVRRMAITGIQATRQRTDDHLKTLLGSTQGLGHDQATEKLAQKLTTLASNPAALASATSALAAPIAGAAPAVADAYQAKMAGAIQYLAGAVPKPPSPPPPFAPQNWTPTATDQLAFHDKAEIVASPMAAMKHVQQGTLSDAHLDALKTQYPVIYGMMRDEIIKFAASHPDVMLPLAERQSIAKFLGAPLDTLDTPDAVRALQASYGGGDKQQPAPPSGGPGQPKLAVSRMKPRDQPTHASGFSSTQGPAPQGAL